MRMMVVFQKGYALRFIGHLDLMRTIQRGLRRSGLPIAYSKGFNPHIRLSFAAPLSVGVIGERELMELPLTEEVPTSDFVARLNAVMPPDLRIQEAHVIADNFPTLMSLVAGAQYEIRVENNEATQRLLQALPTFLALDTCIMARKTKSGENDCDIVPYVKQAEGTLSDTGIVFRLTTFQLQSGALKPSLWFEAFCQYTNNPTPYAEIYRMQLLAKDANQNLIPLEALADA